MISFSESDVLSNQRCAPLLILISLVMFIFFIIALIAALAFVSNPIFVDYPRHSSMFDGSTQYTLA